MRQQLIREAAERTFAQVRKQDEDFRNEEDRRTIVFYASSVLALRRAFGFGQKRCLKFMRECDKIMGELLKGTQDYDTLVQNLSDLGISIEL